MDVRPSQDGAGHARQPVDRAPEPPREDGNPAGLGVDSCDSAAGIDPAEPCDESAPEDLVMEESKPGAGISGFEGEEVGGG